MAAETPVKLWINAYEAPRTTGYHAHEDGQLFALREGLQVIETPSGRWVQPPGWIGWIAPRCAHAAQSFGATAGWSLHIEPAMATALPAGPHVFAVTPLVQALVDRLTSLDASATAFEERRARLVGVLLDELAASARPSLHLPMPQDAHAPLRCRDRLELRAVAAAVALAEGRRVAEPGRARDHGGADCRLQLGERVHRNLPQEPRLHAGAFLRGGNGLAAGEKKAGMKPAF